MKTEEFVRELAAIGCVISEAQLAMFARYFNLLIEDNAKFNLTAITGKEEVYSKHFFDSLLMMADRQLTGTLIDVGSGAGFPGIPLKIMNDELRVTLCEPTAKKVAFINRVIRDLKLEMIDCLCIRAEDLSRQAREYYDYAISRAVAPLPILCELCLPLVRVGGEFWALKGAKGEEELAVSTTAIELLGGKVTGVYTHHYQDQSRINLVVTKVCPTPLLYPRPYQRIRKQPL